MSARTQAHVHAGNSSVAGPVVLWTLPTAAQGPLTGTPLSGRFGWTFTFNPFTALTADALAALKVKGAL